MYYKINGDIAKQTVYLCCLHCVGEGLRKLKKERAARPSPTMPDMHQNNICPPSDVAFSAILGPHVNSAC